MTNNNKHVLYVFNMEISFFGGVHYHSGRDGSIIHPRVRTILDVSPTLHLITNVMDDIGFTL